MRLENIWKITLNYHAFLTQPEIFTVLWSKHGKVLMIRILIILLWPLAQPQQSAINHCEGEVIPRSLHAIAAQLIMFLNEEPKLPLEATQKWLNILYDDFDPKSKKLWLINKSLLTLYWSSDSLKFQTVSITKLKNISS